MEISETQKNQQKLFESFLGGLITWQTFPDKEADKGDKRFKLTRVEHGTLTQLGEKLNYLNGQGAGVYAVVNETNGKGRKAEDVMRVRCVFVDLDGAPLDPVLDDMPDMVVETSSKKYHAYWRIADCPLAGFKQIQQSIAAKYNGDVKVCDLPRVMRVPGFYHHKHEPFLSTIVYRPEPNMITFAEACEKWPPPARKLFSAPKYAANTSGDYKGSYGAGEGNRNQHVMRRLCGAISRGVRGSDLWSEALREGLACDPPLPEHEIQSIFNSVSRYGGGYVLIFRNKIS